MGSEAGGAYDLATYAARANAIERRKIDDKDVRLNNFADFVTNWVEKVLNPGPGTQKIDHNAPIFLVRGIKGAYLALYGRPLSQDAKSFTEQLNLMSQDEKLPISASQIYRALKTLVNNKQE